MTVTLVMVLTLGATGSPTNAGATAAHGTRSSAAWEVNGRRGDDIVTTLHPHLVAIIPGSRTGPNTDRARVIDEYGHEAHTLASGDVNGDGYGDILVGDPRRFSERGAISVLPGAPGGPRYDHRYLLHDEGTSSPAYYNPPRRLGAALAVADLDRDGYDDVVTTRHFPANPVGTAGRGHVLVFWGGPVNLSFDRVSELWHTELPEGDVLLAAGDVAGDRRVELLVVHPGEAGTADRPHGTAGRMWTCTVGPAPGEYYPGRRDAACTSRTTASGITDLAVGDVTAGRHDDVVLGQPHAFASHTDAAGDRVWDGESGGRVWLYRGGRDGLSNPRELKQGDRGVPGADTPGDRFGAAVVAGDITGDGKADLVVGAPGEHAGSGRVTVLDGSRSGLGASGARRISQDTPGVPSVGDDGDQFGAALSLLDVDGDRDPDLVIGTPGERAGRGAITVVPTRDGRLAPRRAVLLTPSDVAHRAYTDSQREGFGRLIGR